MTADNAPYVDLCRAPAGWCPEVPWCRVECCWKTLGITDGVRPLGWWVIEGESLMDMLRRCHEGEDPDAVYAEEYANSEHDG